MHKGTNFRRKRRGIYPKRLNAQPKPPGLGHGTNQNQQGQPAGGGAPIDGGLSILLLLGAAYGGSKVYRMKK